MGLILDTNLLVRAERQGLTIQQAFEGWSARLLDPRVELGISLISLTELGHGIARAESEPRRRVRSNFVAALRAAFPIYGIDESIALRAGLIDGELVLRGQTIGLADVLIAAIALQRGDGVATLNVKHFECVPGLQVVEL